MNAVAATASVLTVTLASGTFAAVYTADDLRDLHNYARDTYGAPRRAGLVSDEVLAALVKARALDLFARQIREVDGRAFAVGALLLHLTPEDAR